MIHFLCPLLKYLYWMTKILILGTFEMFLMKYKD